MDFFDRYIELCQARQLQPHSQRAADMFGVTRATITTWGKNKNAPKGTTLVRIADSLGVSTDYLLGRTDDPTDYANPDLQAALAGTLDDDTREAVKARQAETLEKKSAFAPRITVLYNMLDPMDQVRVESFIEGMLVTEKYRSRSVSKN